MPVYNVTISATVTVFADSKHAAEFFCRDAIDENSVSSDDFGFTVEEGEKPNPPPPPPPKRKAKR